MRLLAFIFCCTLAAGMHTPSCCHSANNAEGTPVRVAVFPVDPLNVINSDGKASGLFPDLIQEVGRLHGWNITFVPGSWSESMNRLLNGEIDLLTTVAHSPDRAEVMDFSQEPVVDIWGQVFLRPGSSISNFLDLAGKRVAIMEKDISGKNFIQTCAKFAISSHIVELATHEAIFQAIQAGEVDAGVAPQHFGLRHARDFGLVASSIQFSPFSVYFTTRKGNIHGQTLLASIDSQLAQWKQNRDSFYYDRTAYWMGGKQFERNIIPRWILLILAGCIVFALFLLLANRMLNTRVRIRTRDLAERELQYRTLVESANTIILRWDRNGHILFLNQYGLDLFGYTTDELLGHHVIGTIVSPSEDSQQNLVKMIKEILARPQQYQLKENENIRRDGRKLFVQWSNRAINDEHGNLHEILSIGVDITDRKQLEANLSQAQKMESLGTLAGGIAHDFNNILAVIGGNIELALLSPEDTNEVSQCLQRSREACSRAQQLVGQILAFSRKTDIAPRPLQLSLVVKETLKMLRATLPSTIAIDRHIDTESTVFADPTHIHQVLMNLCTNAFHAMEEQGGTLGIDLRDVEFSPEMGEVQGILPGEYVLLTISDTGVGMDLQTQSKIFEPYFTTKEQGKGTGLGLAVVHGIVKKHNGHIKVYSEPGQGSSFHLYFPRVSGKEEAGIQETATGAEMNGTERLLLVDDEPGIVTVLSRALTVHGYRVDGFADPQAALQRFREQPDTYDLLITDLTMPGMTGKDLAMALLQLRPGFPVILCTGFSQSISRESSLEQGISELLLKPVPLPLLLKTIRHLCDRLPKSPPRQSVQAVRKSGHLDT